MIPCLNQVTAGRTQPNDLPAQLRAIRAGGWEAVELWLRHWDPFVERHGVEAARLLLDGEGLKGVSACAQLGLLFARGAERDQFGEQLKLRLDQCAALGVAHLVITPGRGPDEPSMEALGWAAENVRWAAQIAAPYGVRLGIEFLKGARLVNSLPSALWLAASHPAVGVVLDTFHLYAGISKLEDLELLVERPEALSFVHVNDVPCGPGAKPRDLWEDSDRVLPGEGGLPLGLVLDALRRAEYQGYVSLELFSETFAARWAADPVMAAKDAHVSVRALLVESLTPAGGVAAGEAIG